MCNVQGGYGQPQPNRYGQPGGYGQQPPQGYGQPPGGGYGAPPHGQPHGYGAPTQQPGVCQLILFAELYADVPKSVFVAYLCRFFVCLDTFSNDNRDNC